MQFPITIGLRRSRFMARALLLLVVTSMVVVLAVFLAFPRSTAIQAGILLLLCILAIRSWRCLEPSLAAIRLTREGQVLASLRPGDDFVAVDLLPGATVHPWLTVLHLEFSTGERRTVLVAPDCIDADDFRRLRVFLRWRVRFSAAVDDA